MDLEESPLSGVELYNARRARWLTPPATPPTPAEPTPSSTSRRRLEQVLNAPDALTNDDVWYGNIEKIWKGLSAGGRLKRRLPMQLVVKIVHAAWLRDNTWPAGAIVQEDDELDPPPAPVLAPTSAPSSGISTPWTQVEEG
ncbi:hypothetical protein MIND_00749000 [Mycena indigotica]|uniref:DUF4050 domain-containing protein n=1 Tax=Mycena indigotica TaxID=2126181 RepID=A0A8H6W1S0_9AGAR|nr:uncharacterized protein MIND_00749000 [Mycena indigotica]KAF7301832.1 hypothetical protein MIND_00749000 [Mycena indigotica]